MRTLPTIIALLAGASLAQDGANLTHGPLVVRGVDRTDDHWSIEFDVNIINIGSAPYDMAGLDPRSPFDDLGIQTYLADTPDLSGGARAAGGWTLLDQIVIDPGATRTDTRISNTLQLPDPSSIGSYRWLVVDLVTTTESPAHLADNRTIVPLPLHPTITRFDGTDATTAPVPFPVPAPPGAVVLGAMGVLTARRRR